MDLGKYLSKVDAISLLELINSCVSCSDEKEFRRIMTETGSLLSYDFALTGLVSQRNSGLTSLRRINISYPAEWLDIYITNDWIQTDPTVRANFMRHTLQYLEDILKGIDVPKSIVAVTNDFGILTGYVHGLWVGNSNTSSQFCFSGRAMKREKRTEAILNLIVPHLHQALKRVANPCNGDRNGTMCISPKEREILKWVKQGKSTWDISVLLGISERTVKFHISNIMQKLDAGSRTHAVAIAIEQGLV
jgi:LuxR family transcriptional regulator, quorum-sensing system regulator CviR